MGYVRVRTTPEPGRRTQNDWRHYMSDDEDITWFERLNLFEKAYFIYAGALAIGLMIMLSGLEDGED